jgi:hypothetical protein
MFLQPIAINVFVYFGIVVSEGELHVAMKRLGEHDVYAFIYSHGLEYKRIGNSEKSNRFIVGKEIRAEYSFSYMKLDVSDGLSLCDNNNTPFDIRLSDNEELEVKQKLYQTGFLGLSNYYLAFNYDKNEKK